MMFTAPHFLLAGRARIDATPAAVVADAVHRDIINDGLVVDVNVRDGHVVHRAVVVEVALSPVATFIAPAEIAKAIIHAAIETNVRSPIARVPYIHAVAPSPVSRCPQQAHRRWRGPRARNPVVAFGTVGPVTGCPDITVTGTRRLFVNRQRGWGDIHGNENTRERRHGHNDEKS